MEDRYITFMNDEALKYLMNQGVSYDLLLYIKNELRQRYHCGYTDGYTEGYHDACENEE